MDSVTEGGREEPAPQVAPDAVESAAPERAASNGRGRMLALISLATILVLAIWFSTNAVAPALEVEKGFSKTSLAWLTISVNLGFLAGTLVSSVLNLADIVNARRLFAISAVLGAALNLAVIPPGQLGGRPGRPLRHRRLSRGGLPLGHEDRIRVVPTAEGTDLGESHTFQYTIDISPPPKKKKTKPAKQRVSITPEERAQRRRAYEQARNQLPHRRELKRRKEKERHEQAKELGLCRTCRSPAMPGRTRCQDCIEKRRLQQIQAREKAIQQKQGTLGQPPLF